MSENWNRKPGKVSLYTYTNAEEVELIVNGKSVGVKKNEVNNPKNRDKIKWDGIDYQPGYIEAIARTGGKTVARHKIETYGKAVALKVEPDNNNWNADGMDLQHIRIYAVDAKGRRVMNADNMLSFDVKGDARIVAVSNGNLASDEPMTGNMRRLYNGSALLIIRAGRTPGKITVKTSSDAFKTVNLVLRTDNRKTR